MAEGGSGLHREAIKRAIPEDVEVRLRPVRKEVREAKRRLVAQSVATLMGRSDRYDEANTLAIISSPRSGSTWLMEQLDRMYGYCPMWEPLRPSTDRWVRDVNGKRDFFSAPGGANEEKARELFDSLFRGQHWTSWSARYVTLIGMLIHRGILIKSVRALAGLGWLANTYPSTQFIFLIRQPYAVVNSMLMMDGDWSGWSHASICGLTCTEAIKSGTHGEESGASVTSVGLARLYADAWACENSKGLEAVSLPNVHFVEYERLYEAPEETLERLSRCLSKQPYRVPGDVRAPSGQASRYYADRDSWHQTLSPAQIDAIAERIEAWGMSWDSDWSDRSGCFK